MNESQFKIVKTMLAFPGITPKTLVKSWNKLGSKITLSDAKKVAVSLNYEQYRDMPEEDIDLLGEQIFGSMWKEMRKAT